MNRGEVHPQLLLRDSSSKTPATCRNHGIRTPALADDFVKRRDVGKNNSLRNTYVGLGRVQQSWIGKDRFRFFSRAQFDKLQPATAHLLFENSIGDDRSPMTTFLEPDTQLNHGMYVARTS